MEAAEALKSAENALRDLISNLLTKRFGTDWHMSCGLSSDRITLWQERRTVEEKKLRRSDPRIIYYADFFDLFPLLKKNWGNGFSEIFGSLKEVEVFLKILEDLRNPDAHRRELLSYEKQLVAGISGKIRTNITAYFSKIETGEAYYPRIESIQDSLGNSWAIGSRRPFETKSVLRPGDHIQFTVSGADPMGDPLEFAILPAVTPHEFEWNSNGIFEITIKEHHVGETLWMFIAIRSPRKYHAMKGPGLGPIDDLVQFRYEVRPPQI